MHVCTTCTCSNTHAQKEIVKERKGERDGDIDSHAHTCIYTYISHTLMFIHTRSHIAQRKVENKTLIKCEPAQYVKFRIER